MSRITINKFLKIRNLINPSRGYFLIWCKTQISFLKHKNNAFFLPYHLQKVTWSNILKLLKTYSYTWSSMILQLSWIPFPYPHIHQTVKAFLLIFWIFRFTNFTMICSIPWMDLGRMVTVFVLWSSNLLRLTISPLQELNQQW